MKSIVLHAPGGTENFIIEERPIPTPPAGWVTNGCIICQPNGNK